MAGERHVQEFDGIICLGGEDWWYHNRGHFDFQILRRIARVIPVLYVNSIGVRFPTVGKPQQFIGRISRKIASLSRGLVRVENDFHVFSPVMIPGSVGQVVSGWGLGPQIKLAAERAGIKRPLIWMHCPAGVGVLRHFPNRPMVLQRTDRFESFPEGDGAVISAQIARLKQAADLVIYCNQALMDEEAGQVAKQLLVTHGVEFARFREAGLADRSQLLPDDPDVQSLRSRGRPIVGFIGGIDHHTFDPELFKSVAERLPDLDFMMVGGCSLEEGWCPLPNVFFMGRKPYERIADYMAICDVLIMPWNKSPWIAACNPIKLKEYLAVGRPVVSTDFSALDGVRDLVGVADEPKAFAEAIEGFVTRPFDGEASRERVADQDWDVKAADVMDALVAIAADAGDARRNVSG